MYTSRTYSITINYTIHMRLKICHFSTCLANAITLRHVARVQLKLGYVLVLKISKFNLAIFENLKGFL